MVLLLKVLGDMLWYSYLKCWEICSGTLTESDRRYAVVLLLKVLGDMLWFSYRNC